MVHVQVYFYLTTEIWETVLSEVIQLGLGSLSKSLRLGLLRLPLLKRSGESTSRQSAKFKLKQSEIQSSWVKELKVSFLLVNFSKPSGFVQRKIAVICFARTNRIFLNENVCRTVCTMTTI